MAYLVQFVFSGCGKLYVADGNWKLRYPHCMWKVPVTVPGFGDVNYPTICPSSPERGHAFCKSHCMMAKAAGYPSELRPFLEKCGVMDVDLFTGNIMCYYFSTCMLFYFSKVPKKSVIQFS